MAKCYSAWSPRLSRLVSVRHTSLALASRLVTMKAMSFVDLSTGQRVGDTTGPVPPLWRSPIKSFHLVAVERFESGRTMLISPAAFIPETDLDDDDQSNELTTR